MSSAEPTGTGLEVVEPRCVVCDSRRATPRFEGIVTCDECGHVYAVVAADTDFAGLYDRNYFFGEEYIDYLADKEIARANFAARMQVLRRHVDPERHRRLLEIGCAYGFFLDLVRADFDAVHGVDIAADGVDYARDKLRLDAFRGDVTEVSLPCDEYDVVCLWDTIEHLPDPGAVLAAVAERTTSGALVAVTTGDIGSLVAKVKGRNWRLIHPPSHVQYFTKESLHRLLDRHGFDVEYSRSCGFKRNVKLAAYWVLVRNRGMDRAYGALERTGLLDRSFAVNLFDIRYVVARRR